MSNNINTVILEGNVGNQPNAAKNSEKSFAGFSIAVTKSYKKKDKNETVNSTTWVNIVCYGKLADIVNEHVVKGSRVLIEGELAENSYTDKQGNKASGIQVVANNVRFLSQKTEDKQEAAA